MRQLAALPPGRIFHVETLARAQREPVIREIRRWAAFVTGPD
jgi:hypothetical protein